MKRSKTEPNRRTVLQRGGSVLVICSLHPLLSGIAGCGGGGDAQQVETHEGWLALPLSDYPDLASAGGFLLVEAGETGVYLAIVRVAADGAEPFAVLDGTCTHTGCLVDGYDPEQELLQCPCHGSEFELDGQVAGGPASAPLVAYPYVFEDEVLRIDVTEA